VSENEIKASRQSLQNITDNRAAQLIYSNPESQPPARIQRWALKMDDFDFDIVHRPGRDNIADYMSRHPVTNDESRDFEEMTERYINFVSENARPTAIKMNELIEATLRDKELNYVKSQLNGEKTRKDESSQFKSYEKVINELSISKEGLVLRGNRIVIPDSLIDTVLSIAHEGHLGVVKTKSLI
jgi:hypothetical protein